MRQLYYVVFNYTHKDFYLEENGAVFGNIPNNCLIKTQSGYEDVGDSIFSTYLWYSK